MGAIHVFHCLIMLVHSLLVYYKNRLIDAFTHARRSIASVPRVTRAHETSFSVVTSCILMAVMSAFDTFIDICSDNWRKPDIADLIIHIYPPTPQPHNTHRHNIVPPKHASETLDHPALLLCIWCLLHRIYLVCICQLTFGQYKHPLLKGTSIVEEHVCCRQEEENYVIMRVILVTFMGRVQPPA